MESHTSVIIKEEHDMDFCDNGVNFMKMDFDVQVKIENTTLLGDDWYLENNDLLWEIDKQFADKDFVCNICNQSFSDSHLLYQHNLEHLQVILAKDNIYECDLCSAGYLKNERLTNHRIDKHKNKGFENLTKNSNKPITKSYHQCKICKKLYQYKHWYDHMRTVHAKQSEKCKQCGKVFKCYRYLERHIKYIHDGIKPRWRLGSLLKDEECVCDECGKKFYNEISLKTHKKNCHSARTYQCYICKSVLKSKAYLMAHIQRVHYFDGLKHACTICKKTFRSPRYLKVHIKNSHNKSKKLLPAISNES